MRGSGAPEPLSTPRLVKEALCRCLRATWRRWLHGAMNFVLSRLGLGALLAVSAVHAASDVAARIPVFSGGMPVKASKSAQLLLQREDVRLRIAAIEKAGHRAELAESAHPYFGAECRAFVLWDRAPGAATRAGSWRVCTSTTVHPDEAEFLVPMNAGAMRARPDWRPDAGATAASASSRGAATSIGP